jgi:hypothetical protein
MHLVRADEVGPQGALHSLVTFGTVRQGDFLDGASTLCSVIHIATESVAAKNLGDGFGFASAATGCAGLLRDAAICIRSVKASDAKGFLLGSALAVYDASKVVSFAHASKVCSALPSWAHTAAKGYALGICVAFGLYDDLQVLRQEFSGIENPLQKVLLQKKWWVHAFNAGGNLSTLIYAISVIAGYALAPAAGIFLATTYLLSAVVAYVFTKDMEQAAIQSGINNSLKKPN